MLVTCSSLFDAANARPAPGYDAAWLPRNETHPWPLGLGRCQWWPSSRALPLYSYTEKMAPVLEKQLPGVAGAGDNNNEEEEGLDLWQVRLFFQRRNHCQLLQGKVPPPPPTSCFVTTVCWEAPAARLKGAQIEAGRLVCQRSWSLSSVCQRVSKMCISPLFCNPMFFIEGMPNHG